MRSHPVVFPSIPEDTARAAASLFGKGNIYLELGEHINGFLSELVPFDVEVHGRRSPEANALYAVMTILQFGEELTDSRIAEAVRRRADLRYALHLPMSYLRLEPGTLCEFRRGVRADPPSQQTFQGLLDRLAELCLLKSAGELPVSTSLVLDTVCTGNRFEMVVEAMLQALETLAATDSEWLRQVTLPHWYERYSRRAALHFWPGATGKPLAPQIGADIRYLLGQIDESLPMAVTSRSEIEALRHVWEEQFEPRTEDTLRTREVRWRPTKCASCTSCNNGG